MSSETSHRPTSTRPFRALPSLACAVALLAGAFTSRAEEAAPSRVNMLLNLEFSNMYLTPRGMIVQNEGLVVQPLALGFANVHKGDDFITDVTLVGGVWSCYGTARLPSSDSPGARTSFYEMDPIVGISVGLGKKFKLDVTYTAFSMQILNIPFSQHLETKLSFDDTEYLKAFALHPYLIYWQELDGKATAARVPFTVTPAAQTGPGAVPNSSYYFDLGIAPAYTFESSGIKLEAPCRMLMPSSDFYGEFYSKSSVVALYELGLKGTVPMKFMPKGYGNWGFHAGFKFMGFVDKNLQGMQQFNATGKAEKDAFQLFCGVSSFF